MADERDVRQRLRQHVRHVIFRPDVGDEYLACFDTLSDEVVAPSNVSCSPMKDRVIAERNRRLVVL
eukprot:2008482-Rhodomonas_salina.1